MRTVTHGILNYVLSGTLAHRRSFSLVLAEHLPSPNDALDVLLEEADRGEDSLLSDEDLPDLEFLGLDVEALAS